MPHVVFTSHLQSFVSCPAQDVPGDTVRAALERVFAGNPALRDYVVDEQGHLRRHVVIFVDGRRIQDCIGLSDRVAEGSRVYVLQALSGG
jgi:hypothetical protein